MIYKVVISCFFSALIFAQNAFSGLNTWTHGSTVGFSGGGYLISFQNEFRNAAMLVNADRSLKLSIVRYPADINAQSAIINTKLNNHHFGFAVKNINYGTFDSRTADNILTGSFSANDTQIQINYARFVYKNKIILGVNNGLFFSQLEKTNASLIKISPTALLKAKHFSASIVIENYSKVLNFYTNYSQSINPSVVFSIHKSFHKYPLEVEMTSISNGQQADRLYYMSMLYKTSNNLYIKGGISTNRAQRNRGSQLIKNILNDSGFGLGYEFDDITIDFNTYSYSNSHSIYGISISSKF